MIRQLWVLYDADCGFCCNCARWLAAQPHAVAVQLLPQGDPRLAELFPGLPPPPRAELTVVDDRGGVYFGDNAWLMAMWALRDWRPWSIRFATPTLRPMARQAFELISASRHGINLLFGLRGDAQIAATLHQMEPAGDHSRCGDGRCSMV